MSSATELQLSPSSTATVVIDMQNDFCDPVGFFEQHGRPSDNIRSAIGPLQRILQATRETGAMPVFTRIIFKDETDLSEGHSIPPARAMTGVRLQAGTWGADIAEELRPQPGELVLDKPSYSAFYSTDLEEVLRGRGIRSLIITGTVAYACVLHTAFDAFVRGFDVVLASDAVASWYDDLSSAAYQITDLLLGRTVSADEIVAALQMGTPKPDDVVSNSA